MKTIFIFALLFGLSLAGARSEPSLQIKVMTWNIWGRLNQDPRYTIDGKTARDRTVEIIRGSGADIVAMIETYGSAKDIAERLGFHHYTPGPKANLCIFSRYPLEDVGIPEGLSGFSFIAATAVLPDGKRVRIYDIWLTSGGRHIVEINNKEVSDVAFSEGDDIRHEHLETLLQHPAFKKDLASRDKVPLIVAGDFNCVSHLDHNKATKHLGINHSRALSIKVSLAMEQAGFTDTYRAMHPEITEQTLGHTWTTVGQGFEYESGKGFVTVENNPKPEYRDPYARIDYIYSTGTNIKPTDSRVILHHASTSERSFPEFPSDHAAVLTSFAVSFPATP